MNQTQLIIYDNASGIVQYELDLYDTEPIQLTKQIFDVENPEERVADFSRTIKVPGTHNNNEIFGHFFDLNRFTINESGINFNNDFNVNYKANAYLYANGVLQSRGYIQLTNVINNPDASCEYEIVFIGEVKNIFVDISEKRLYELDLSEFDHTLNADTITSSWSASQSNGYVYPLIDYGISENQRNVDVASFRPAIYAKTLVDKIFSESGYTYTSSFFDSNFFKSMIIPCSGDFNLTEEQVEDRTGSYSVTGLPSTGLYNINYFGNLWTKLPFNNIIKDTDPAGYDISNFEYEFDSITAGTYEIESSNLNFQFITPTFSGSALLPLYFRIRFILEKPTGERVTVGIINQQENLIQGSSASIFFTLNERLKFTASSGDRLYVISSEVFLPASTLWPLTFLQLPISVGDSQYTLKTEPQGAFEGAPIVLTNTINRDIRQGEYLTWLVKMFNLYIEASPTDNRRLIIEPRKDYYVSGFVDWTDKVDYNSQITIKPVSLSKYKEYIYQFAEDTDFWNYKYNKGSEYPYGNRQLEIDNQFTEEVKEVSVGFAPTPLSRWQYNNYPISQIKFADANNARQIKSAKPRILFYKRYQFTDVPVLWRLVSLQYGIQNIFEYPYAGHIDDIFTPTFDLNFGVPDVLYYNPLGGLYTNANLFNTYWIDYIRDISDPDSKLIELTVKLNEVDINNLSFRRRYLIDRQYYILQSLEYDLINVGEAKATLLKLTGAYNFIATSGGSNGGGGDFTDGEVKPAFDGAYKNGSNNYDVQRDVFTMNTFISGVENTVGGPGFVNGSGNTLSGENANAFASHDSSINYNDVTLINTTNYNNTLDGETAIQDVQFPFSKRIILTDSEINTLHTTPVQIVPDASGFIIEYVNAYAINRYGTSGYAGHKIFIQTTGGADIAEFNASFSSASQTSLQQAKLIDQPLQSSSGLGLIANGNLSGGDGTFEFVIQYRLLKI